MKIHINIQMKIHINIRPKTQLDIYSYHNKGRIASAKVGETCFFMEWDGDDRPMTLYKEIRKAGAEDSWLLKSRGPKIRYNWREIEEALNQ